MKLGLIKALKRLEPYDAKVSRTVLRGRRRWQHLFCYPTIKLVLIFGLATLKATETKPDLQKVYNEALTWSKEKTQEIPSVNLAEASIGRCEAEPALIVPDSNKQAEQKTQRTEKTGHNQSSSEPQILVFVSLSLPKASLVALARDAQKYNAKLILRGVKNNSFKEMLKAIQSLGKELEGAMEINPELFKEYDIKAVPTFVLVNSGREINRLRGNVSLSFAVQKLKEET